MKAYSLKFVHDVLAYRVDNSARDTREHFKISNNALIKWTRRYGGEYGLTTRIVAKDHSDDIQMMRALRNDGMILAEIADKFDVSTNFVQKNTSKPRDLISASAFANMIQSGNIPTEKTRITMKNKIVGTFVPE